MNHQPFNNWIYQEESLSSLEEQELQVHMKTCPTCQGNEKSWSAVQTVLKNPAMTQAPPGFVNRWQANLAERRQKEQRRQVWLAVMIIGGIFLVTLAALLILLILNYSPVSLFTQIFGALTGTWLVFLQVKRSIIHWFQSIPVVAIGISALLFLVWGIVLLVTWSLVLRISTRKGVRTK
mgnify:CR=1 FL=1